MLYVFLKLVSRRVIYHHVCFHVSTYKPSDHPIAFARCASLWQIENLFYNMSARRKSLQNSADDYPKIVDLICRFAIHHTGVNFSCRKVCLSLRFISVLSFCAQECSVHVVYVFCSMELLEQMFTQLLHPLGLTQLDLFMGYQLRKIF